MGTFTYCVLQETKSKYTVQYVIDNFIFLTISTVNANQPEYAGVGFVLFPMLGMPFCAFLLLIAELFASQCLYKKEH